VVVAASCRIPARRERRDFLLGEDEKHGLIFIEMI
jgi:hypothetical protein